MGDRVRMAYVREVSEPAALAQIENLLELWIEDEDKGATVHMKIDLNAGRGKGKWLPRGFPQLAGEGPRLILGLVAELRREQARSAELRAKLAERESAALAEAARG